jgi:phosphatidylserine/phosphatidylglycerophosphate/cardiolipin synthase-like enzyme
MYSLTLDAYTDALIEAHSRGVEVRVILDRSQAQRPFSDDQRLRSAGISVRYGPGPGLMHHKFAVVDGRIVVTGSYNATWRGTYRNAENAVIIDTPHVVEAYEAEFSRLWNKATKTLAEEASSLTSKLPERP